MRDLNLSIYGSDLIDGLDLGAEATVHAEDFVVDDGSKWKVVEDFSAVLPGIGVTILPADLVVEAIDRGDLPGLVIAPEESDPVGVLDFEAEEELEGLNRMISSIHKISNEDVAGLIDFATYMRSIGTSPEEFEKVVELPVDIPANGDWGSNRLHI